MKIVLSLDSVDIQYYTLSKFTNYTISIKINDDEVKKIVKTIKDLNKLCCELKKEYPAFSTLKFSEHRLFFRNSSIQINKEMCENMFAEINKIPNIIKNHHLLEFLELDENIGIKDEQKISSSIDKKPKNIFTSQDESICDFNLGLSANTKASVNDFQFIKVIGKGSFGRVYLVLHKEENKYYAMKVLEKSQIVERGETRHIMTERAVLMKCIDHPFLVYLKYSFQTSEKLYFVLRYVNGGELFFHLQKEGSFSESRVKFYAAEIGHALGYLHSLNIIYRDLKPENILIDFEGHVAITDFGLAKQLTSSNQTATTFCGTPEYLAPEIILKQPYNKSVDWWCFGCVIYEMLFGLPPFYSQNVNDMYEMIITSKLTFNEKFSLTAKAFLETLLKRDKNKRLGSGSRDFEEIKEHSFLKRINWDDLIKKKIKPPYIPQLENELDLKNIDVEFLQEDVTESVQTDNLINQPARKKKNDPFMGFTYVNDRKDII